MSRLAPLSIGLLLAVVCGLALASGAAAQPEGEENDISAQIKAQMQKIIDLMRKNEEALLELSAGGRATPVRVDVEPPALPPREGEGEGNEGERSSAGEQAAKDLEELIRGQQRTGERIPGELEELVRMVPL